MVFPVSLYENYVGTLLFSSVTFIVHFFISVRFKFYFCVSLMCCMECFTMGVHEKRALFGLRPVVACALGGVETLT